MRVTFQTHRRNQSGYALIITMAFLVVSLIVFASMMSWSATNAQITTRNNLFNQSVGAAESGTENSLAFMIRDFVYGTISSASRYETNPVPQTGWPITYTISNYVFIVSTPSWTVLDSQFAGLSGMAQYATNSSTATPLNEGQNLSATVQQVIQFASIPVFQYAIFYNMDLEINPGNTMTINGQVHSNNNIWATGDASGNLLTFNSIVEAAQAITLTRSTNDPSYTNALNGNVVFTITNGNPIANGDSLQLPVGTNSASTTNSPAAVEAILNLPPAPFSAPVSSSSAAYSSTGQVYLINEANLIISNTPTGTMGSNITVYFQDPNDTTPIEQIPFDVTNVVGSVTNKSYSFVSNTNFYDYREADTVQAVQIDVGKLNTWLTNSRSGLVYDNIKLGNPTSSTSMGGQHINSIYVYNSVPLTSTTLPAVRIVNGAQLPQSGLTIATPQPIYVKGNYNVTSNGVDFSYGLGSTTNTSSGNPTEVPAALMGDAITVLSGAWNDNNNSGTGLTSGQRNATDTTINAAALEGIVQSYTDSSNAKHYSGGVENFLRLLEDWGTPNATLSYNGSIVVMFPSEYATNNWPGTGSVYNPPIRAWGFDVNFQKQTGLPPDSPSVRGVIRSSWAAW
jgi:hypothetical protein